jgi:hypothetical protein
MSPPDMGGAEAWHPLGREAWAKFRKTAIAVERRSTLRKVNFGKFGSPEDRGRIWPNRKIEDRMDTSATIALITLAATGIVAFAARRPATEVTSLSGAMDLMGIDPADAEAAGQERTLTRALDRCRDCKMTSACTESLSRHGGEKLPQGCPNTGWLTGMAAYKIEHPIRRRSRYDEMATLGVFRRI